MFFLMVFFYKSWFQPHLFIGASIKSLGFYKNSKLEHLYFNCQKDYIFCTLFINAINELLNLSHFCLVLGVFSDSCLYFVYKSLWFFLFLAKKTFKFFLNNRNNSLIFDLLLVLLLGKKSLLLENDGYKRLTIMFFSTKGSKIIFTFLTKVITLYIDFTTV